MASGRRYKPHLVRWWIPNSTRAQLRYERGRTSWGLLAETRLKAADLRQWRVIEPHNPGDTAVGRQGGLAEGGWPGIDFVALGVK